MKSKAPNSSPRPQDHISFLAELSSILTSNGDIAQTLDRALETVARHLPMKRGAITLISLLTGETRIQSSYGLNRSERERGRYARGEGITGRVIESGKAMCISNVSEEPLFLNKTGARNLERENISFICVPISLGGQVVGTISMDCEARPRNQLDEELNLLTIAAALLGHVALEVQEHMDESSASGNRPKGFVGNSQKLLRVFDQMAQVAQSATTVLLLGESGTGKELAARGIHAASARAGKPFISLNCAALPENLIESELFGHERGAFTGANTMRKGRFELANGGTLFLDEVGDLSLPTQAKLLRAMQERAFERLGGMETRHVDVRFITATNRNLERMVEEGTFRRDLFYRLNVFAIHLPPLRERQDDILPLATHYLKKFAAINGRQNIHLAQETADLLQAYAWPGNIRELANVMERAILLLERENVVLPRHLPGGINSRATQTRHDTVEDDIPDDDGPDLQQRLDALEKRHIIRAMERFGGNMGKAAEHLGLTPRIMALRLKKHGLDYKMFRH